MGTVGLFGDQIYRNAFTAMSRRKCAPSKWIFHAAFSSRQGQLEISQPHCGWIPAQKQNPS
jgi:hypothetical protein